jgi:uncharacterized protein (TIGR04255 family)
MSTPRKLKKDAIAEALFEFRFQCDEIPEAVLGHLLAFSAWSEFEQIRLPTADLPWPIQADDPGLLVQPRIQLVKSDRTEVGKIGPRVASYHMLAPYAGWVAFEPRIRGLVEHCFASIRGLKAQRLGLRYINILTAADHRIGAFGDLALSVSVGNRQLSGDMSLIYNVARGPDTLARVSVSSPEMVIGPEGPFAAVVDVDVATRGGTDFGSPDQILSWMDEAHEFEKEQFFSLIPDAILKDLVEE